MRVLTLADLGLRDEVRLPSGRYALVKGFAEGRVELETFDGEELDLLPEMLVLVRRAPPRQLSPRYFDDIRAGRVP